ncbi:MULTISPECIES: hypothetical protein [unclassified Microcoleus]|uniref:hypothetical protein n=1 Tax=unclassified Microcoleus TaxID=2642155 RepID=UPI0025DB9F40|nr:MULTISPECIES: hypothetical protein [unclassified Microcoleus]
MTFFLVFLWNLGRVWMPIAQAQNASQNPQCAIIGAGASVTAVDRGLQWQKSVDEYLSVDRTFWKYQSN